MANDAGRVSRRGFVGQVFAATLAAALVQARGFVAGRPSYEELLGSPLDIVHDTFNGLLAFVVPGRDAYSTHQGVTTPEPGGVEIAPVPVLAATLDGTTFLPNFSAIVAATLNGLAQTIDPAAVAPFQSPFANLPFAGKAAVFQIMDATDPLKPLAGVLPAFVAFFCYSESGVFDVATRTIAGEPPGWRLSAYQGVADGRDEFLGYFGNGRALR